MSRSGRSRGLLMTAAFFCVVAVCGLAGAEVVDKVLVVVNDEVVTQKEFDRLFDSVQKSYEENFKGEELQRRLQAAREGILEQLVNSKLAISLAKKEKIKIDETELEKRIEGIKSYYPSEEAFHQALSERGTNLSSFEKEIREQMLAQSLVEKEVASKIVITPGEINDLYDKNKEHMVAPKTVKVRGILVRKTDDRDDAASRKKMDEIMTELDNGKDFATVANEESEGPYAANGGDMGYVVQGQLLKELDGVIFSLNEGQRSDVIETPIGYHVFLAEEVREPHQLELAEVNDYLRERLYAKKFEENLMKWLEEKKKNAYISYK